MTHTINLEEVYGTDAQYIDDDSAAALSGLRADVFPCLVEACETLGGGSEPGIDCNVAKAFETLDDFDASRRDRWREKGQREEIMIDGLPARHYEALQMLKGQQRHDMIVIDCGECRAVLSA